MKKLLSVVIVWLSTIALQAQDPVMLTTLEVNSLYKTSSRNYAGVHDPSIVYDGSSYYYIFGSHNAVARTNNLQSWTGVGNSGLYGKRNSSGGVNTVSYNDAFNINETRTVTILKNGQPTEVAFGNFDAEAWQTALPSNEGNAWTVAGNMWAPDVIWNPQMQRWCMYLSLNGPTWNSVIILLTSDRIGGPYVYQGPVVYSGFRNESDARINWKKTDLELVIGTQSSLPSRYNRDNQWGSYLPHAIDPCVFYDAEGQLWMTYGSWSGGIYALKLNNDNGLRDYTVSYSVKTDSNGRPTSDPYFGTQIAGGYYVSGEGSYIQRIGDYYHLFVTYGGLEAKNGYVMRCFRSKNPDGPYVDAQGKSAVFSRYVMNYGTNDSEQRGNLLMSSYGGSDWHFQTLAEVAQGHNSAIVDDKGRAFLIYHTRFNSGNEGFQDRVHQLFQNQEGWLVTAPMEFTGETLTDDSIAAGCKFTADEIAGSYRLLIHRFRLDNQNLEYCTPREAQLNADGTITGGYTGRWSMVEGTGYINITVSNISYKGVVIEQTVNGSTLKCIAISGLTASGSQLWGYKVQPKYAIAYNVKTKTDGVTAGQTIYRHVDLTTNDVYGVNSEWISSEPSVVSNTGKYNPADTVTPLTLTHRYTCGNYCYEKTYNVRAQKATEQEGDYLTGLAAYYDFDELPLTNAYDASQTATLGKLSGGTAPELADDGLRVGRVMSVQAGTHSDKNAAYCRFPNPLKGRTDLKGFTVSLWVKRAARDMWGTLWSFNANPPILVGNQKRFFLTGNSYMGFTNLTDTFAINYPRAVKTDIAVGTWSLVTVVADTAGVTLYVNHLAKTKTFGSTMGNNAADFDYQLLLDHVADASYFTIGLGNTIGTAAADYDDLLIYDRALSADDVYLLYLRELRLTDYGPDSQSAVEQIAAPVQDSYRKFDGTLYDLTGRRIVNPQRGFYIRNGKKYLQR